MTKRILPEPVARIYKPTAELETLYPGRKFRPDGHLVGSIGEVVAAEALGLILYPMSRAGHDAYDALCPCGYDRSHQETRDGPFAGPSCRIVGVLPTTNGSRFFHTTF